MASVEDELASLNAANAPTEKKGAIEAELEALNAGQSPDVPVKKAPSRKKAKDPDSLSSSVGRAVDGLQADFGGTVEALGEQFGSEGMAKAGADYREKQYKEAEQYGQPSISSYKQVDDLGDAYDYAKETLTSSFPGMGAVLGAGAAASRVAPGPLKYPAAVAGSLFASLGINIGDVQNQIKQIDPNAQSTLGSLAAGGAISLLDVTGAGAIAKPLLKTLGKDVAEELMINSGIKESVVKAALKHAALAGVGEGATSSAQSVIGNLSASHTAGVEASTEKVIENAINAAIGGNLAGAVAGAGAGALGAQRHNSLQEGTATTIAPFEDGSKTGQGTLGRAFSALGSSSTKALEPWARHSTEMKDLIQSFRPDMTGATATGRTVFEDARLNAGKWRTKLDEIEHEIGGKDNFNTLLDDYQNNEVPNTPEAQKFKGLMDEIHTYAKTEGKLDDIGKIERFLPISADPETVRANRDAFIADILPTYKGDLEKANAAVDNWLTKSANQPDQVPNIIKAVDIDAATGELTIDPKFQYKDKGDDTMKFKFSQGQIPPENSHLEKQRTFAKVPQAILSKYAKEQSSKDRFNAVHDYVEGAAHRTAFSKRFGPRGEIANARIAKAVRQAQAAGYRPTKAEVKRAFDQLDTFNGMLNPIHDRNLKVAQSVFATALTIKTLPLAGLSTLVETMTPAIRSDVASAMSQVVPAIAELSRGVVRSMFRGVPQSQWATMASEAGLSLSAATNVAAQRLGASGLTRAGAKITTKFFLINGLTVLTHATRVYAAKVGDKVLTDNLRTLAAGVPLNSAVGAKSMAMLRSMGVEVKDTAHASALYSPTTPSEIAVARQMRIDAMHRFATQSVIEPTSADVPMWMSDNRMHLVAMLHRYPAAFTNTLLPQLVRRMSPGWNGGYVGAASAAVGSLFLMGMMVSLGYVQDELKMVAKNGTVDYEETRTDEQRFVDVLNMTLAPIQAAWISDFFNAPRYGSSGFGSLSPALGFGEELGKSVFNFQKNPSEGAIYQFLYKNSPAGFFRPGREAAKELDIIE